MCNLPDGKVGIFICWLKVISVEVRSVDLIFQKLHCACLASNSKVQFSYGGELCCNVCARKLIRGE